MNDGYIWLWFVLFLVVIFGIIIIGVVLFNERIERDTPCLQSKGIKCDSTYKACLINEQNCLIRENQND